MIDLNDPEMKEIIDDFVSESESLLKELNAVLEQVEDDPSDGKKLEEFGQVIDRMMGAAQTMGFEKIGYICQMGKLIGYKAGQHNKEAMTEMTSGVLFDLLDLLENLLAEIKDGKESTYDSSAFISRLEWLAGKFGHIKRASCSFDGEDDDGLEDDVTATIELQKLIGQFKN